MKILSSQQIKKADAFTIQNEPIASIDLMERAATTCFKRLIKLIKPDESVAIACGMGNNGGDGLAIARMLLEQGFDCNVFVIRYSTKFSSDAEINYKRLTEKYPNRVSDINSLEELKEKINEENRILIDALLGTGINKAVEGFLAEVIDFLNVHFLTIYSIDVPSGLQIDSSSEENKHIIRSSLTFTFQLPKLAFLFSENQNYVPEFEILDIGLNPQGISEQSTSHYFITKKLISSLLKRRNKFSHKGTYGHALLIAGSKGKSGAAIIASKACMSSGAGLFTLHSIKETISALLHHLPEAMSSEDANPNYISEVGKLENYDALAFGPGVGLEEETQTVLKKILNYYAGKLVIDADGLNILSENKTWLNFLPASTILTPHPKEFDRLTQNHSNDFERFATLKQFVIKHNCIVILKGAHSALAMPDGNVFFNSSGNPGLAKAGSGDGLTGIILGLLSRGYNPPQAALIGTYINGYAADLCLKKKSMESILISDVIEQLPKAFKKLEV